MRAFSPEKNVPLCMKMHCHYTDRHEKNEINNFRAKHCIISIWPRFFSFLFLNIKLLENTVLCNF